MTTHRFHLRLNQADERNLATVAAALSAPDGAPWARPTITAAIKAALSATAEAVRDGTAKLPAKAAPAEVA